MHTPVPATAIEKQAPNSHRAALITLASVFFMWGFITSLNDILAPHLKAVFELNYTRTMLIQFVFFGAYFLMSLPAAKLLERLGYQYAIVTGLITTGIGALLFVPAATTASYAIFLSGLFILATGITILQVAANPYVSLLGPARTASSRLNLVQALNSLGTTTAPLFGGYLILSQTASGVTMDATLPLTLAQRTQDALAVRAPYIGIALVLILLAAVIFFSRLPKASARHRESAATGTLWQHSNFIFGLAAMFLYVGAEVSVGSFLISYISSPAVVSMSHADAAFYVSLFWGGAMIGRIIGAGAMRYIAPSLALAVVTLGACACLGTSLLSGGWLALVMIVLVGLMNSIMFPTIFTLGIEDLGPHTARGSALLIMAIVGGALVPMMQGICADHFGLHAAFVIPLLCYLYIFFFAVRCHLKKRNE